MDVDLLLLALFLRCLGGLGELLTSRLLVGLLFECPFFLGLTDWECLFECFFLMWRPLVTLVLIGSSLELCPVEYSKSESSSLSVSIISVLTNYKALI